MWFITIHPVIIISHMANDLPPLRGMRGQTRPEGHKNKTMENENRKITFEKRNKEISKLKDTINYIIKTAKTKQEVVNRLRDILLGNDFKIGYGERHVWCSNNKNERIFIITGF
jgi:hypothetical protein